MTGAIGALGVVWAFGEGSLEEVAKVATPTKGSASALVTHHVFLDTQVYWSHGHNPDSPLLLALRDQIAADRLVLHITDITLAEIKRQLGEFVGDAAAAVKKARRQFGGWKKRLPRIVTGNLPDFDQIGVAKAPFKQFLERARDDWRVVNHDATAVAAVDIFRDYFRREPPFENQGSKEFPDAFVVRALEDWCKQNGERMYVIGADRAMVAAVQKSAALLHMQSLPELLQSVAVTESPDIVAKANDLLEEPQVRDALGKEIEGKLDDLIAVYVGGDLADGEVSGHELNGEITIDDFNVLAASDQSISVLLRVTIPLKITIDYEDQTSAFYDKEDDRYYGGEAAEAEIEAEPVIRVFAKLTRKPTGVSSVQLMTSEFDVNDTYEHYCPVNSRTDSIGYHP